MIGRRFPLFLVAGGIAALANIGSRWLLNQVIPYVPSIVLAYLVGMVTAFVLNRAFVFKRAENPLHSQVMWFTIVNIAALLQTLVVSVVLADWVFPAIGFRFHAETVAHVIGVVVPVFTSYIGHKRFTFRA